MITSGQSTRFVADNAPDFMLPERRLLLAVIKQALIDLTGPDAKDAVEFLTMTLWDKSEGTEVLPFRDVVPVIFTERFEQALRVRVEATLQGVSKPPKMEDEDGAMTYAEVAVEMVSK